MPHPFKLNKVAILVKQVSQTSYTDPDFRETVGAVTYGDPVTVYGQVNFGYPKGNTGKLDELKLSHTGTEEKSFVHFVFSSRDLIKSNFSFNVGDIIISVAGQDMDLEVFESKRPESFLNGRPVLTYVVAKARQDRRESK